MIGALFDIVNPASEVARRRAPRVCRSATQTRRRRNQNHLQIPHAFDRRIAHAGAVLRQGCFGPPAGAAPLPDVDRMKLRPALRASKSIHHQGLD
jgi:hypothetical protein